MPAIRSILLLCGALLPLTGLVAQEQESKLVDRIMRPNMELRSSFSGREFQGAKGYGAKSFNTREFAGTRAHRVRSFDTGRSPDANRTAGFGKYTYRIPDASTYQREAREASQRVETETVPVHEAREASRSSPVRESPDANREFRGRGKSQDIFDQRAAENRRALSIDELRELLNKSK